MQFDSRRAAPRRAPPTDRPSVHGGERIEQLVDLVAGPVRIGAAQMRVAVEDPQLPEPLRQTGEPRLELRVGSQTRPGRRLAGSAVLVLPALAVASTSCIESPIFELGIVVNIGASSRSD